MRPSARYRLSVKFLRFRVTIALQLQINFRHPRVDADIDAQESPNAPNQFSNYITRLRSDGTPPTLKQVRALYHNAFRDER